MPFYYSFRVIAIVGLVMIYISPVYADIYKYVDKNGVMHFTDSPKKEEFVLYFKKSVKKEKQKYPTYIYDEIILKASRINGISFSLIKALIKVESDFNPDAVSKVGAKGLMQLMPVNIKNLQIKDPFNPYENIMGGAFYFRKVLDKFNGRLNLALAAYNAGPTIVAKYNSVPPYKETRQFVKRVLKYNYHYK